MMATQQDNSDSDAKAKRSHAVEIVQRKFSEGLADICDPKFLSRRYKEFEARNDPIYAELLRGMDDKSLAATFVSYWTIGQTIATQSRFWLEDAVAEIIYWQAKRFGRKATHVYSQAMLGHGYLEQKKAIADIGEEELEHLADRRPWRPDMKTNALREVDILVGEQERQRVDLEQRRKPFQRRTWTQQQNQDALEQDGKQLKRIADAVSGTDVADVAIQCNLLVVEPDRHDKKAHAFAFRFVNPKTISSHAQRKQERVNLLRLYAYLVQEKLFREPPTIHVCIAELLPRLRSSFEEYDHYPDYFSSATYMTSEELWRFIGVPFTVVSEAIRNVAAEFRDSLIDGLRDLLPKSKAKPKLLW